MLLTTRFVHFKVFYLINSIINYIDDWELSELEILKNQQLQRHSKTNYRCCFGNERI